VAFGRQLGRQDLTTIRVDVAHVRRRVAEDIDVLAAHLAIKVAVALLCHGGCVVQIELLGVLLVQVCHEDLKRLVVLVSRTRNGSHVGNVEHLSLCFRKALAQLGTARRRQQGMGLRQVQVPVVTVHLANHVGATVQEQSIHGANFVPPAAVRAALTVREEEVLATVEHTVRSRSNTQSTRCSSLWETGKDGGNLENARQARQ